MTISDTIIWDNNEYKFIWHDADDFENLKGKNITQVYGVSYILD